MQPIEIIFYVALVGLAILCLAANLITNRLLRKRITWLYIALWGICLFLFGIMPEAFPLLLSIGFGWPTLVAILINQQKPIFPLAYDKAGAGNWLEIGLKLLMIALPLTRIVTAPIGNWMGYSDPYQVVTGEMVEQAHRSQLIMVLIFGPLSVAAFVYSIRRIAFCEDGIYVLGMPTPWTDFESYHWIHAGKIIPGNPFDAQLVLTRKKFWINQQVRYRLSPQDKARLEPVLAQKLPVK